MRKNLICHLPIKKKDKNNMEQSFLFYQMSPTKLSSLTTLANELLLHFSWNVSQFRIVCFKIYFIFSHFSILISNQPKKKIHFSSFLSSRSIKHFYILFYFLAFQNKYWIAKKKKKTLKVCPFFDPFNNSFIGFYASY